ncbi:hypothetical protein E2C01_095142 [Portunus trituberculatus]|uniref:Uncharacterized protein n=1 Tax=Portunus trituberculatus TaxID=210409 RepID=A0A5B7JUJ1_PORTR|nr:hypothetical protein [Portunus trituberculatus]
MSSAKLTGRHLDNRSGSRVAAEGDGRWMGRSVRLGQVRPHRHRRRPPLASPHTLGVAASKAPRHTASSHGRAPVVGVGGDGAGGRGLGRDGLGYGVEKGGARVWYDCEAGGERGYQVLPDGPRGRDSERGWAGKQWGMFISVSVVFSRAGQRP